MARLDARRLDAWRSMQFEVRRIERLIDDGLRAEWDISLGWFEVLAGLQRFRRPPRPLDLAEHLSIPASSLSRRLDRLAEEGWIERMRTESDGGVHEVRIELTASGRRLWREMNVTYRRLVDRHVSRRLDDGAIESVERVVAGLTDEPGPSKGGVGDPSVS